MRHVFVQCIAVLSLFGTCAAQRLHPCRFSGTSNVGHVEGITVQRLTVMEKSGKVGATVFIPDGNEPLPSIVFSHSAIHGPNNDADLLRFAWAMARAGAASIVLDGVINCNQALTMIPFVRQNFSFVRADGCFRTSILI